MGRLKRAALLDLWMLVFGLGGSAFVWEYGAGPFSAWFVDRRIAAGVALLALGLIGLIGAVRVLFALLGRDTFPGWMPTRDFTGWFRQALLSLRRDESLGLIAGVYLVWKILGFVAGYLLTGYYYGAEASHMWGGRGLLNMVLTETPKYYLVNSSRSLVRYLASSGGGFLPFKQLASDDEICIVVGLVVVAALLWVRGQMQSEELTIDDEGTRARLPRLTSAVPALVGVLTLGTMAAVRYYYVTAAETHTVGLGVRFVIQVCELLWIPVIAGTQAVLFAGTIGMLRRKESGEPSATAEFITDAMRSLRPLLGIFALLGVLAYLPESPFLQNPPFPISYLRVPAGLCILLLFFAPFASVAHGMGFRAAIRRSVGIWLGGHGKSQATGSSADRWRTTMACLTFAAIGVALFALPNSLLLFQAGFNRSIGTDCSIALVIGWAFVSALQSVVLMLVGRQVYRWVDSRLQVDASLGAQLGRPF